MEVKNEVLKRMYCEYRIPCDSLVSDPEKLQSFTDDYNKRTGQFVKPAFMGKRMLNLRRKGEAKGGLKRLRRGYNGRNNSQN